MLIPYWKKESEFCRAHNVRVAFEMHPGFCVYNPETMMRIRKACGDNIGANFDPSHLFWQGIDPVAAIRYLGDAIFYFHAKDTKIDEINTGINGVLDTKPYSDEIHRSLDLPLRGLRPRPSDLEGHDERPADGGLRRTHLHRA